jgi:hypothetical protein
MGRRWLTVFAVVVGALASTVAHGADDVSTLEKQLADELSTLSTSDCNLACRALASIRRAAERICALEPGPRCDAARAKATDATRRVQEACPECAVEQTAGPRAKKATKAEEITTSAAPVAESARAEPKGGCRSCSTASGSNRLGFGWLALLASGAFALRRASKKVARPK